MKSTETRGLCGGLSLYELARAAADPGVAVLYDAGKQRAVIFHPHCNMTLSINPSDGDYVVEKYGYYRTHVDWAGKHEFRPGFYAEPAIDQVAYAIDRVISQVIPRDVEPKKTSPALMAFRRACARMRSRNHVPEHSNLSVDLSSTDRVFLTTASPLHTRNLFTR